MKKIFVLLSVIVLLLTSCSFGILSRRSWFQTNDKPIAKETFKKVLEALQNREGSALKAMFSEKAIAEAENFDETMADLIAFFNGDVISIDDIGGPVVSLSKKNYGTCQKCKSMEFNCDVETSEQKYRIAIKEFTVDTADPDNVGISSLYIIKAEDSDLQFAYWGDGQWTPGITIDKKMDGT